MNTQNEPDLPWNWGSTLFGKHDYSKVSAIPHEHGPTDEQRSEIAVGGVYVSRRKKGYGFPEVVVESLLGGAVCYQANGHRWACALDKFLVFYRPKGEAETQDIAVAPPQPTVTPQFGEMWRRNRDGSTVVITSSGHFLGIRYGEMESDTTTFVRHPDFLANYTRVEPKPALNWRPITEWDMRDIDKKHIALDDNSNIGLVLNRHWNPSVDKSATYTHFAEIELPK